MSTITQYQGLEAFETIRRPENTSIQAFLNEFHKRLCTTKSYRLLKSANLSNNREELIKAIIPKLKYDSMKDQLKKTFSDSSNHVSTKNEITDTKDTFLTEDFSKMTIARFNTEQE